MDKDENVWVGGNGISKLDSKSDQFYKYDYWDGLQSNSFKIGADLKSDDGVFYMGGIDGLNYFYPQSLQISNEDLPLIFTDLHVFNKSVEVGKEYEGHIILDEILNNTNSFELRYDQNDFSISFSALGSHLSNRIVYRYKLEGYDRDWQMLSINENRVFFSNLDYGKYLLQVQCSPNNGLTWGSCVKKLEISILPPWWLTPFAKAIYIIFILAIGGGLIYLYIQELKLRHRLNIHEMEKRKNEENHQFKLQFFMNISHEFKTPLTLILSSIEKQATLLKNSGETVGQYFETVLRNASKLTVLINELMDFRRYDVGKDTLNLSNGNIGLFILQIISEFEEWAAEKKIKIVSSIENDIVMPFDQEKIAKIMYNLLSNAIKYTDKGGSISVMVKKSVLGEQHTSFPVSHKEGIDIDPTKTVCLIAVKDDGIGITKESISHIYERFFQVKSRTSAHLGSGIGLAIVKNMTILHGGTIIVSSQRNKGAEFLVALPLDSQEKTVLDDNQIFDLETYMRSRQLANENNATDVDNAKEDGCDEKQTILIVEDNEELLLLLKGHFEVIYNVLVARDGLDGLEKCKTQFPDIILSDVMMPCMDGVEMCKEIRNNLSIAYIPIILLTAKSDVEYQIEGYESGADLYIPKPFSLQLLEINIKRLLKQKNRQLSEVANNECNVSVTREEILADKDKQFVEKLNELIHSNLDNPDLSVDQLCREMGVGRTKLYVLTKELCGQALGDYIRNIRLYRAAHLLRCSDMNVKEIIYETGFGSNSHFSKVFKSKFGTTPTDYAKGSD